MSLRLAEVDQQRAAMMLAGARVVSPIDGIVTRRNGDVGEFVRAAASGGAKPLFTIMQARSVRIVTHVPDRDVPLVDVGDPATFQADAFPGRQYHGKVSRIAGAEDAHDRSMIVEIDLDNSDGRLRPGMYGRVEIRLDTQPGVSVISIPSAAVFTTRGSSQYYCFRAVDGHAALTPISLLQNTGIRAEVSKGLNEGDMVLEDATNIRDGQAIKPVTGSSTR